MEVHDEIEPASAQTADERDLRENSATPRVGATR